MDSLTVFGPWLKQRRKALDFTQAELAGIVGCAMMTIQKIEAEERRPSKQLAERLADVLAIAADQRPTFVTWARGAVGRAPAALTFAPRAPDAADDRRVHNLPLEQTSFVGRERELAAARLLLNGHRLVTLTGPGGTGKTRLALRLAASLVDAFADGVWLTPLARLQDPALVAPSIAAMLSIREEPRRSIEDTLLAQVRHRHLLLVLDNCEHVVAVCAQLVHRILQACPQVRILATSRERLAVDGEVTLHVPPLALPTPEQAAFPETVMGSDAVQLFVARARAAQPGFAATNTTGPVVAQICADVDGHSDRDTPRDPIRGADGR